MSVDWDRAACKNSTIDFTSSKQEDVRAALGLCGICPIRLACREWADLVGDVTSILGGEDVSARKARWAIERKGRRELAGGEE